MVKYRIFSSEVYSQYIGMYTGYGIEAVLPDGTNAGRIETYLRTGLMSS